MIIILTIRTQYPLCAFFGVGQEVLIRTLVEHEYPI